MAESNGFSSLKFFNVSSPFLISYTVKGLKKSKLTWLCLLCSALTSLYCHLRTSRKSPTDTRLRPGTIDTSFPFAIIYEKGKSEVSGWFCIFPKQTEKEPIFAGSKICEPLAIFVPLSNTP